MKKSIFKKIQIIPNKFKKKIFLKLYKRIFSLKFILKKLKFRLYNFKKFPFIVSTKLFKIYHNNNICLNTFILKNFLSKNKKLLKRLKRSILLFNNKIVLKRKLRRKKKKFLNLLKKKKKKKFYINFFNKILFFTFKVGKKALWNIILNNVFESLSLNFKYSISVILLKIFIRLYTRVELKKVISRKRVTFIPFFIKINRSIFLALKWIFLSASKSLDTTSFKNKIYIELTQILTLKSCFCVQKVEENNFNSFKNRANSHYRW